ncbi:K+ transporter Trk [Litoreibacter roseus]|uniref:K+ transporter Trk n=1 Tax=Litoreibacter roseus TaxID=2601869 RepID=A0A6N6JIY4_9RHOB|nr:K+ transporter Trk [Litoreibacter roseus]
MAALDSLFISTSAVSTTGLVSVDPGTSFTFFGELVIIILIQIGGLGYMTIGSFAVLALQQKLGRMREKTVKAAFNLPNDISPAMFLRSVIVFTFGCEIVGAAALYPMFVEAGVDNAMWSAIFHSISAFCTAGFSLNSNSFESFSGNFGVNIVISALSLLGAMGFLIIVDTWRTMLGRSRHLGFTSKVIFRITALFLLFGTLVMFIAEPGIAALPNSERLMVAFFQTMTATTTVGFNTYPIGEVIPAVLMVIFFLMVIGASPAGTGGGIKTTSFAALIGLVRSTLKGRERVRFFKRQVPLDKLQTATALLTYYCGLLMVAMFCLLLTEPGAAFEVIMFEAISAMGTVGLSMGITGDLSDLGKLVVIALMTAGRVGILTFGIALAAHDETREEEEDNQLIM